MSTDKKIEFRFEEIPLEEAKAAVLAGAGNYADLKATILENLPRLDASKAFAFGLPNGKEVPEDQRRGIVNALNSTCKKGKLDWRVTYSGIRKLFICVPKESKFQKPVKESRAGEHHASVSDLKPEIEELHRKGKTAKEIAKILGIGMSTAGAYVTRYRKSLKGAK